METNQTLQQLFKPSRTIGGLQIAAQDGALQAQKATQY